MSSNETQCNSKKHPEDHFTARPPVSLEKFLGEMGLSPVSGWRFRKRGWIRTVNIAGRHYVPYECVVEFNARAARGEFSREPANPSKNGRKANCGLGDPQPAGPNVRRERL